MRHKAVAARTLWCPIMLLLLIGDGGWLSPAWAQTAPPLPKQEPPTALSVDLNRIKGALEKPVNVRIDDGKIRFYAETVASGGPTFKQLSVNFDLFNGGVPGAGMTHKDFLTAVTPKELYSSAGIKPVEVLQMSLVNYAAGWALQSVRKLYKELSETRDERRKDEIRKQIDRELAALRGGR